MSMYMTLTYDEYVKTHVNITDDLSFRHPFNIGLVEIRPTIIPIKWTSLGCERNDSNSRS